MAFKTSQMVTVKIILCTIVIRGNHHSVPLGQNMLMKKQSPPHSHHHSLLFHIQTLPYTLLQALSICYIRVNSRAPREAFSKPQAAVVQKGACPQRITGGLNSVCAVFTLKAKLLGTILGHGFLVEVTG